MKGLQPLRCASGPQRLKPRSRQFAMAWMNPCPYNTLEWVLQQVLEKLFAQPGVQPVAQGVSQEIKSQNGQHDAQRRKHRQVGRIE